MKGWGFRFVLGCFVASGSTGSSEGSWYIRHGEKSKDYARIFKKWEVDMEIVQPTMLTLLPLVTGVGFQNFHCAGGRF